MKTSPRLFFLRMPSGRSVPSLGRLPSPALSDRRVVSSALPVLLVACLGVWRGGFSVPSCGEGLRLVCSSAPLACSVPSCGAVLLIARRPFPRVGRRAARPSVSCLLIAGCWPAGCLPCCGSSRLSGAVGGANLLVALCLLGRGRLGVCGLY